MDATPRKTPLGLHHVLERTLAEVAHGGLAIFDLDGTLLDNRPRKARIVREYGERRGVPALLRAEPEHWLTWNLRDAMRRMGLSDDLVEALHADLYAYWEQRFFTTEYCTADRPVFGAPAFVRAVAEVGGRIAYVTGRPEQMRKGTVEVFAREGFPLPGEHVNLLMKPSRDVHDDAWKMQAVDLVRALGKAVVAAFDNEPTHLNTYREAFPDARVVRVTTEHSGRPVVLAPRIDAIPSFGAL